MEGASAPASHMFLLIAPCNFRGKEEEEAEKSNREKGRKRQGKGFPSRNHWSKFTN
jgi:hypothetical protein